MAKHKREEGYIKEQKVGPKHSIHPGAAKHHQVESIADPKTGTLKKKVVERPCPYTKGH
jgi:hypothetical protein